MAEQMKLQQTVMECDQIKCEKEDEITVIRTLSNKCTAKRILVEVGNFFLNSDSIGRIRAIIRRERTV